MAGFVLPAIYENEGVANDTPIGVLTDTDTISSTEALADVFGVSKKAAILAAFPGAGGDITKIMVNSLFVTGYVDDTLAAGTGTGQLDHPDNLLKYAISNLRLATLASTINSGVVFESGTNYDGPELIAARSLEGSLQSQFPVYDVRLVPVTVAITID